MGVLAVIVLANAGITLMILSFTQNTDPWSVALMRTIGILMLSILVGLFYRAITRPRA